MLAERAPTADDGSIALLPDGRMHVVYKLRQGVTWQDGDPFTSRDLLFSYHFNTDPGVPYNQRDAITRLESVEAPDDLTFVVNFKGPFKATKRKPEPGGSNTPLKHDSVPCAFARSPSSYSRSEIKALPATEFVVAEIRPGNHQALRVQDLLDAGEGGRLGTWRRSTLLGPS